MFGITRSVKPLRHCGHPPMGECRATRFIPCVPHLFHDRQMLPHRTPTVTAHAPAALSLGVVIVNYNTEDLTLQCVRSLLTHGIAAPEQICVVDNLSPDGSGQRLKSSLPAGVGLILSPRNGGFGAGVNIGVAALSTDLVLVLNPDTYFLVNQVPVIQRLFAQTPNLGVAGLKLINPDGPFQADWVMGTGFVVRRTAFDEVGRMDEGYFLYFEEVDLCARMWVKGWQVMAVPEVELVHEHQRHSQAGIWSTSGQTHLRSMVRFFTKFGVPWVRRPHRSKMKSAYLKWRRQVIEHGVGSRSDAQV